MIALWTDRDDVVVDRRVTNDAALFGADGVVLIGHPRKVPDGADTTNLIDIATLDAALVADVLAVPVWQLSIVAGLPVVDIAAVAPTAIDPPAILTVELEAAIDAVVALDHSRGATDDHAARDTAGQELEAALADSRI